MNLQLQTDGIRLSTGQITDLLGRNGCGKSQLMRKAFARHRGLSYLPQTSFVPSFLKLKRIFDDFVMDYAGFERRFPEFRSKQDYTLKELSGGQARFVETCLIVSLITKSPRAK